MPDTQQQWLTRQLLERNERLSDPDNAPIVAEFILSAWPSSPQGLAAKQVVEAATLARRRFSSLNGEVAVHVWNDNFEACTALDEALFTAREAGLG